uniref:Uncharacterized protein n=1 Tax=viral metagenome TaxID=1070528 RepID=A0A6C0CQI6_9ZZZZ
MDSDTKKAIEDYYKLKNEYETKIDKQRKKIRNDKTLSKQQKRRKMLSLVPKCINCGKSGGTKFSINKTTLRAVCGNTSEPCPLNIEVNRGLFEEISETYNFLTKESESIKEDIIKTKLDLLFNYVNEDDTIAKFEELRGEHKSIEEAIMELQDKYENIILGKRNAEEIVVARQNLYDLKRQLNDLAKQYEDTGDEALIQDMVEMYIRDIRPEAEKLRDFKYAVSKIECSDGGEYMGGCDDDIRVLVQEPYTREQSEISITEEPVVIANIK